MPGVLSCARMHRHAKRPRHHVIRHNCNAVDRVWCAGRGLNIAGFSLYRRYGNRANGTLDAQLVYDTCQEMYFQYGKIQPYLRAFREKMNLPEFLISIERLIEGSETGRRRLDVMRKNLSVMADLRSRPNT